jgi:hypothetical protein
MIIKMFRCIVHRSANIPLPRTATQVATFTGKDWPSTAASADGSMYLGSVPQRGRMINACHFSTAMMFDEF